MASDDFFIRDFVLNTCRSSAMLQLVQLRIEIEHEEDGRWIAEIITIPGALCYGTTREEAIYRVESLVLRVLADKIEHGEATPELSEVFTITA